MNVPFFQRLSYLQARNTLLLVFLLAVFGAAFQIHSDLRTHRRETEAMLRQILAMQEKSAALAAWGLDSTAADRVVEGLLHYGAIRKASLISDSGLALAERERPSEFVGRFDRFARRVFADRQYSVDLRIQETQKPIGMLAFTSDGAVIAAAFIERTVNNLLVGAVPLVILSLILVAMFHRLLTRPLVQVSTALAEVDVERPMQTPLQIPAGHNRDELGLLAMTINQLLLKFEQSLEERRLAEKELQAAERKYHSIFENAIEGIYQTTLDGKILNANPAMAKAIGYASPEELIAAVDDIGRQLYVEPQQRDELITNLMRDGIAANVETRFLRRDGTILWASVSARIVRDQESGTPVFIEGTVADITSSKKAMADLARVEAQLMQAQKMEALGNLAGGIAHDFNNLLQIISGTVQLMLLRQPSSGEDYRQLNEVYLATGRAADLVRRLLTFSRKVEVSMVSLDLNEVVLNTMNLLRRTVPKMIELKAELAPDLPATAADPGQIEQVLVNLANNGVQAMEEAGTLTIGTKFCEVTKSLVDEDIELQPGRYLMLWVADTGHGMDKATRQRIFEPFFTTKELGKGTGLGLSSVYGIVTAHGGRITCRSQPGCGATFTVYLPVVDRTVVDQAVEELSGAGGGRGSETILVVDDEATILEIAGEIFRQHGYAVLTASCGEEAVSIYEQSGAAIDLVLMDLGMPGMGGKKCLEVLRSHNPAVKVIVASGYSSYGFAKNHQAYGAAAFLAKPYRLDTLLTTVRQILDGS